MQNENVELGDIVWCKFPTDEGGSLPHPALVVSADIRHKRHEGKVIEGGKEADDPQPDIAKW